MRRGCRGENGDWLEAKRRALYVRRTKSDSVETRGFRRISKSKAPDSQHSRCPPFRQERGQAPAPSRLRSQSPFPRPDLLVHPFKSMFATSEHEAESSGIEPSSRRFRLTTIRQCSRDAGFPVGAARET